MRKIEYLSPTCIEKYIKNKDEFYYQYLCEQRPPKVPQNEAMAAGSAFDAYVKSCLHSDLFGPAKDPKYDLKTLFEAQVEPQNRDKLWEVGAQCLAEYKRQGAYADIMLELSKATTPPKFEISVSGIVNGYREGVSVHKFGVTFLGKPDLFFVNSLGAHVILDWKVNGFYSKWGASPTKGYIKIRNDSRNSGHHKDAHPMNYKGIIINGGECFEAVSDDWARQLCIYAWLLGEEVGNEYIVGIDQLAWKDSHCRVASHRYMMQRAYQWKLFSLAQEIWEVVHSDHIFRDRSKEESQLHCEALDKMALTLRGDEGDANDQWFAKATRDTGGYRK